MRDALPPGLDNPFVRAFVEPLEALSERAEAGQFDGSQPATELQSVFETIERGMHDLSEEDGRAALLQVLRAVAAKGRRRPDVDRPTSWEARVFTSYLAGADRATVMLLGGELQRRPQRHLDLMRAAYLLDQAANEHGERLTYAVGEVFHLIAEPLFRDTVRLLYQLECVRQNRKMKAGSFGKKLEEVGRWLPPSVTELLDSGASRLRNAHAHGDWRYVASDGVIQAGRIRLTPRRALERARRLLWSIEAMDEALQCRSHPFMHDMMATSPIGRVTDPTVYDDEARVEALGQETWNHMCRALGPAVQRLKSLGWPVWPT